MRHQTVHSDLEQHDNCTTNVLPDFGVVVIGQDEKVLNERINVDHKGLRTTNDELVNASNGMRTDFRRVVLEELEELWDEKIEWTIEGIGVEHFRTTKKKLLTVLARAVCEVDTVFIVLSSIFLIQNCILHLMQPAGFGSNRRSSVTTDTFNVEK